MIAAVAILETRRDLCESDIAFTDSSVVVVFECTD